MPTLRDNQIPRSDAGGRLSWLIKARRMRTPTLSSINAITGAKGPIGFGNLNELTRSFGNYGVSVPVVKSADDDRRAMVPRRIRINGGPPGESQGGVARLNHKLGELAAIVSRRSHNPSDRSQLGSIMEGRIDRHPRGNPVRYSKHGRSAASGRAKMFEPSLPKRGSALANPLYMTMNGEATLSHRVARLGPYYTRLSDKSNLLTSNPVGSRPGPALTGHASRAGREDSFRLMTKKLPDQSANNASKVDGRNETHKRRFSAAYAHPGRADDSSLNKMHRREPSNQSRYPHRQASTAQQPLTINFNPTVELRGLPDTASKRSILDALSMHSHELILMIEQELAKHKRVEFLGLSPSTEVRTGILS
jgi:hypothetical protein